MAQSVSQVVPLLIGDGHLKDIGLSESGLGKQLGNLFLDVCHYIKV